VSGRFNRSISRYCYELPKGIVEDLEKQGSPGSSELSESDPSTVIKILAPESEANTSTETESMTAIAFDGEFGLP
jgi:hypothetical protein